MDLSTEPSLNGFSQAASLKQGLIASCPEAVPVMEIPTKRRKAWMPTFVMQGKGATD